MRKSIRVSELVREVNRLNRESTCEPAMRAGWNDLLAHVLHETGNYSGFGYLEARDVPAGEKPGIIRDDVSNNHQFPDETRRRYIGG